MATKPIKPDEIPEARGGRPRNRVADVKAFLRGSEEACEVIIQPGENPGHVYTSLYNAIITVHAGELVRVTRRYDRVFLIRQAPFGNAAQFKG